jgi:hypothetical protein
LHSVNANQLQQNEEEEAAAYLVCWRRRRAVADQPASFLLSLPLVFFASLVLLVSLNVCLVLELDDEDNGGNVLIGQS